MTILDKILSLEFQINPHPSNVRLQEIEQLAAQISSNQFSLKGEDVPVLSGASLEAKEIGAIDRDIAEELGYVHPTANAFVITPKGKVLIQRRNRGKTYPLHLSIFGGHLGVNQTFEEGMCRELLEEMNLQKETLGGKLDLLGFDFYNLENDSNKEKRGLFTYQLTEEEYLVVQLEKQRLEEAKRERTYAEFTHWMKLEAKNEGLGEVWGMYEFEWEELINAPKMVNPASKFPNQMCRYLQVTDVFKDATLEEIAFFTPDLLDLALNSNSLTEIF